MQGAILAKQLNVPCKPCEQAPQVLCFLQNNFWNASGGYLTADVNVNNVNRSGINSDPILASILVFDANATCNAGGMLNDPFPFHFLLLNFYCLPSF